MTEGEVFAYEKQESSVKIWRCFSYDHQVDLPERMEGLPVTELAPYAFSSHMDPKELEKQKTAGRLCYGTRGGDVLRIEEAVENISGRRQELPPEVCGMKLETVALPKTLQKIGKYAFYNCDNLRSFSFYSALSDLGAGLFTGCHHVRELTVSIVKGQASCLREVLLELSEELRVNYYEEDGAYTRLLFPEFYEEGVENTPARILMTEVHGSGIPFRNCFQETRFQFGWYDERFDLARFQEGEQTALELALGRLWYPLGLSEKARITYEAYVRRHLLDAGRWILEQPEAGKLCPERSEAAGLRRLLEAEGMEEAVTEELLEELTGYAQKGQRMGAVSYLMDLKHRRYRPRAKTFEL